MFFAILYGFGFIYNLLAFWLFMRDSFEDSFWYALIWPIYYVEIIIIWIKKLGS